MKRILYCALAVLITGNLITSCSKKNDNSGSISVQELLNYYFVDVHTVNNKQTLCVLYFIKDGDSILAVWDKAGARRATKLVIKDNKFVFDLDANGSVIYSFTFKRDSAGGVGVADANFKQASDPQSRMDAGMIIKNSDAPALAGRVLAYQVPGADDETRMHFATGGQWSYDDYYGSSGALSWYFIGNNIGWKADDPAKGGTSMGVVVPKWNGDEPMMLFQTNINRLNAGVVNVAYYQ